MMNEGQWIVESTRVLVDSPWLRVDAERCRTLRGSLVDPFYRITAPDWVLVIACDEHGQIPMVRQYRHGMRRWFTEFPAGIIDAGEDALAAAKRELAEETGWGGGAWNLVRSLPVNPDRSDSRFHIVLASGVAKMGASHLEAGEDLHVLLSDPEGLDSLQEGGGLEHPHHILAWNLVRNAPYFADACARRDLRQK